MKKSLSLVLGIVIIVSMFFAGGWIKANANSTGKNNAASKFLPSIPDYAKLDPEIVKDTAAAGVKVTGKELHGYNGQSYMKPGNLNGLTPLDARGFDKKGIAILVDFPVENAQGKVSDVPGVTWESPVPNTLFDDVLNGDTYNPFTLDIFQDTYAGKVTPTDRTLKNYFKEVSYDQFGITVDVTDWLTLPQSYEYYLGQNDGHYNANGDAHMGQLVVDAINLAKANGVNFANYAVPAKAGDFGELYGNAASFTDENGNVINQIVPNIFIIHRGTGAEYSTDPSVIWSHKWDILSANYFGQYYQTGSYPPDSSLKYTVVDGVVVNTYNICPEVGQDITGYLKYVYPPSVIGENYTGRAPSPADPGVFCHEFSHVLGLPDQYDYGYESEGTGMFTLMASGSYGRDIQNRYFSGFSPVHLDAWSKYYLGFLNPIEIKPEDGVLSITLNPVETSKDVYRINVPGSNGKEYFLLENRQQIGFDKGLAYDAAKNNLHGLVVWHVDENVLARNFDRPNEAANWDWNFRGKNYKDPETGENHYGISVVQADGRFDMEKYANDGDSGDAFPGTGNVKTLSPDIKYLPNTTSYYMWGTDSRSYTGITINNINENPEDHTVTFNVYFAK